MSIQDSYGSLRRTVGRAVKMAQYSGHPGEECPYFPQLIQVEPTNACNLRCVHCHHHEGNAPSKVRRFGMMNPEVFEKVAAEAAAHDCAVTLNVQGEPTLHPRFADMVAILKSKGVFTSVITNATRLDEALSAKLVDCGLDRIVFSFDSIDKATYEKVRVRSKFEPTLSNVLGFIRMNHERGHRTHVCMSMVFQSRTRGLADAYEKYFSRLPVDKIFLNPLLNLSGSSGSGSEEIDVSGLMSRPKEQHPVCRIPWDILTVNWDGEVCPCPVDVNLVYSVGNVKDSSLWDLWNNDRMRAYRRAHLEKDFRAIEAKGPLCSACNCRWQQDYDMSKYPDYAVEAVCRAAVHFAPSLVSQPRPGGDDKYANLLLEISGLAEGRLPVVRD
jgi:radical SAM protein with 4Fe4S-binding SPASM domain